MGGQGAAQGAEEEEEDADARLRCLLGLRCPICDSDTVRGFERFGPAWRGKASCAGCRRSLVGARGEFGPLFRQCGRRHSVCSECTLAKHHAVLHNYAVEYFPKFLE